jgi:hypothetical protein
MRLFWLTLALALAVTFAIWGRRFEHQLFSDSPPRGPEFREWRSTSANCTLKLPPGSGWTQWQVKEHSPLSLQHKDATFHIVWTTSRIREITPSMIESAKTNSKAKHQAGGNRSDVISGDWTNFHGVRAYRWIEKQFPPQKEPYFSTQMMFIRNGREYSVRASSARQDPLKDPVIEPLVSAFRFLDER